MNLLAQTLKGVSGKDLRGLIDEHKTRMGSGVILLIADVEGKAAIAVGITDDMKNKISAVDIIKIVSERWVEKAAVVVPILPKLARPIQSRKSL